MASSKMTPAIGIYLGTYYSCVGVWHDGRVKIIANDQGNMTAPSCVAFTPNRRLIGEAAAIQADKNPTNTIFDMNRLIGRRFSDPTVQSDRKLWPFNVIEGADDKPKIVVQYRGEEKQFFPEELFAMILAKLKEIAEKFLNCIVRYAVVTVPAYFNDSQRRATVDASVIAGLRVMHIMDVPIAAAVAYSFKLNYVYIKYVLVFNLSISTFDVSVVENNKGVFKVKTTAGDTHLGGKDFDNRLLNYFLQQIKREHKKDISDNPRSIRRLRSACKQAKKTLSFAASTTVEVACLYEDIDFSSNITKDQFDEINMDLFERCMGLVTKCLEDAGMKKTDIRKVVLVGGNTQIPMVQKMLLELFDGNDHELCKNINLNSVVAYGAALQSVMSLNYCKPPIVALREIGNANKKRFALQRELSEAKELIEKLMFERDDAKRLSETAQKLTQQLMSERDDATKLSVAAQKQLMSERDDARKLSEMAQKQLMCERDDDTKLSESAHKLAEQLMSEKDDAKKCSEAAQKLKEQLISERDYAIEQVEELRWLTVQQAPCRKCVGCFIGYSCSELEHATNNFHESFKLGEGGFGKVYKGILHNSTTIAIKILHEGSSQGAKAFHQEVEVLSKLQHPNLVKLIGACAEIHALIYEYLPNGSLEDRLQCKNNTSPLSWQARVRIAFEICSALSFLHSSKPHGIVHDDLKPDNVLLDLNNVSKLSDFGLCRQLNLTTNASRPFHYTDCPKGTFGYIDPEYFTTGTMTHQNDVYSFGIMLLQLVTCKDPRGIRQSVEEEHRKGTLKELIDASAGPWPFKEADKMISLGLRCSDTMRINRPDLLTVIWKEMKSMADVASASQSSSWAASLFRH